MKSESSTWVDRGESGPAPEDLAELHGAVKLTEVSLLAAMAAMAPCAALEPAGASTEHLPALTTIYAYSLARGWFGAEEISERLRTDGCLRYLSCGLEIDSVVLQNFRRAHGTLIRRTLALVLERSGACGRTVECRTEASRRVHAAVEADSLALEW